MLVRAVRSAVEAAVAQAFPGAEAIVEIEVPRDPTHGDYATNIALMLAKPFKKPPRALAEDLATRLRQRTDLFSSVDVAGPGFVNVRFAPGFLQESLTKLLSAGGEWGKSDAGGGQKIQVEFVSANPTGPLNVVNARAAAFGSTLTRLLKTAGYDAEAEFYVNDVGGQIDLLGATFLARYREAQGHGPAVIPEGGYQGEYLLDLARELDPTEIEQLIKDKTEPEAASIMARLAVDRILRWQETDLRAYGVVYDRWFRQSELYPARVEEAYETLKTMGHVETKDGAEWFQSTKFGDDQDRVVIRANKAPTYFLADVAYHADKHARGFGKVVDIWGPDHHGYIARMMAGAEALGYGKNWLEILLVQQVNLLSGGQPVKMSKRRGEFITLRDLLQEVGKDAATFFFLMRRAESHLDFDIDLAKKETDENPVYYVKYAHARISGILRKHREAGGAEGTPQWQLLVEPTELALMKTLLAFPDVIAGAAKDREPHRLTGYLRDVAQAFHLFYHNCRVIGPDPALTATRLGLTHGARIVLANGLGLMNVDAPERM
ncbi:MAG TPA: arginine--tRNA ligase [Candidatus Eisenbacteria bacterium]|nr:arginine--tRNA ligase [Candidatus Eisenbacteria bacterium]